VIVYVLMINTILDIISVRYILIHKKIIIKTIVTQICGELI
jgi:hypothetical protein